MNDLFDNLYWRERLHAFGNGVVWLSQRMFLLGVRVTVGKSIDLGPGLGGTPLATTCEVTVVGNHVILAAPPLCEEVV